MKQLPLFRRPYGAKTILEVGGGNNPFAGVTHTVDKFPEDNIQRSGDRVRLAGVLFREGDLEAIPFPDEPKFDFIYVSHVLEHVHDPRKAVDEINRVSLKGYLETPSPLREQIISSYPYENTVDSHFHNLFCWFGNGPNRAHVIRKSKKTVGDFCDCPNGRTAKVLFDLRHKKGVEVEGPMPGRSKITRLYFEGPIDLMEHPDFSSACRGGFCGYGEARFIRERIKPPFYLFSNRARRLKSFFRQGLDAK